MTNSTLAVDKIVYLVEDRNIAISKDVVERYSNIVCPVSEKLLSSLVKVLGHNCNDTILSTKIESDMEKEIQEYEL